MYINNKLTKIANKQCIEFWNQTNYFWDAILLIDTLKRAISVK